MYSNLDRHTKIRFFVTTLIIVVVLFCLFSFIVNIMVSTSVTHEENAEIEKSSWNLSTMNADDLNSYSTGENETIAFLDTGINDEFCSHLENRIVAKFNVNDKTENVTDKNGHGTEMVSVACGDGYCGVYGLASKSKIIVVKITDGHGKTNNKKLLQGLKFAHKHGASVVNISIGGYSTDNKVAKQIKSMTNAGVCIVASSGDMGDKDLLFPASLDDAVVSVAATQEDGSLWKDSNIAKGLSCAFPGIQIAALDSVDNKLEKTVDSGTSQACAIASSYISLYRAATGIIDYSSINDMLQSLGTLNGEPVDYVKPFKGEK